MACGFELRVEVEKATTDGMFFSITSSTKVFHSPHEGHLPNHLGVSYPQF